MKGRKWKMCELITEYIERGKMEGIQQGIKGVITTCKDYCATFEQTATRIKNQFGLDDTEVQQNMQQYW